MNISLLLVGVIVVFTLQTFLLLGCARLLKVRLTLPKAIKITILSLVASLVVGLLVGFLQSAGLNTAPASGEINPLLILFGSIEILFTLAALAYFIREEVSIPLRRSISLAALVTFITWTLIFGSVISLRAYVVEPFIMSGSGMEPTYSDRDQVLIQKVYRNYGRNDVVIFTASDDSFQSGRIIGLPGEQVDIKDGILKVNGKEVPYHGVATTSVEVSVMAAEREYITVEDNQFYYPTVVPKELILGSVLFAR